VVIGNGTGEEAIRQAIQAGGSRRRLARSERAIIKDAQRGSPEALETLVRRYWAEARRLAAGIVADASAADDVAQEWRNHGLQERRNLGFGLTLLRGAKTPRVLCGAVRGPSPWRFFDLLALLQGPF
jgi:hypothetical protein